jgi:hypothetical protein
MKDEEDRETPGRGGAETKAKPKGNDSVRLISFPRVAASLAPRIFFVFTSSFILHPSSFA